MTNTYDLIQHFNYEYKKIAKVKKKRCYHIMMR